MRHRQAIALLSLIGFFVSLYLWLYKIGFIGQLKCGSGACEYVQTSRWSVLFGMPVAFYGVVGYGALLVVALVGLQPAFLERRGPSRLLAGLATGGAAFTVYLTYVELYLIGAVCRWCVTSAVIIGLIWVAALAGLRKR